MMATILLPGGTCNASCYEAKRSKCTCGCGGTNHGHGAEEALVGPENLSPILPFYEDDSPSEAEESSLRRSCDA